MLTRSGFKNGLGLFVNTIKDSLNTAYVLPAATNATLGGVKIGSGINVANGTISIPTADSSTNGLMSSTDKAKLDLIDDGADVNAIEAIYIDGVKQTITNKKVDLDLSDYVKGTDVASALRYKGNVSSYANLPTVASAGDVYNIQTAGGTDGNGNSIKAGDNVVRTSNNTWDVLAGTVDLSNYVVKVTGKDLSTNDFTNAYKTKLDGVATSANNYVLPTANATQKGGVVIGSGLVMNGDTVSVDTSAFSLQLGTTPSTVEGAMWISTT